MAITFSAATPTDNTVTATLTSDVNLLSVNSNDFTLRRADTDAIIGGINSATVRANGQSGSTWTWTISFNNDTNYAGDCYIRIRSAAFIENPGFARQPPSGSLDSNTFKFVVATLPAPSTPGTLSATAVDHDTIRLNFGASTGTVTQYQYRQANTQSGLSSASWINGGTGTTITIDGLSPSRTYYFQVRAVNQNVFSAASNVANATTESDVLPAPSTPASVAAAAIDTTSVRLTFDASTGAVTQYQYRYATTQTELTGETWRDGGTGTTITVIGLPSGTLLYFQVRALNGSSPSAASAVVSATTEDIRAIAEIAHQSILFLSDYELKIRIRGNPDEAIASGDLEFYSHYWNKAKGELVIYGAATALLSNKIWNVRAYWKSSPEETLKRDVTWDTILPAPIIKRPTHRIIFVKGLEHKYDVEIHNFPAESNFHTLLLGLGQEAISAQIEDGDVIEHAKQRIVGTISADYDFAVNSGEITLDTANSGGTDRETGIPFDILDTEPDFSFSVVVNPVSFTLFWTTVNGALDYEYKFWKTSETETEEWTSVGDQTSIEFDDIEIGESYSWRMRVGSPWIGTPPPTQTKATVAPKLTGLTAGFGNPTTVFLAWSPVENATHYEWRRNGGNWNETTSNGARDDNVPTATTLNYDVRVSQPFVSNIESFRLVPKPVTDLVFSDITTTSARVVVPNSALPTVSGVRPSEIEYRVNSGEWTKTRTAFSVSGSEGQTLKVDVRVSYPWISPVYSESVTLDTTPVPTTIAPSGTITLSAIAGDKQVALSWNHPSVRGVPTARYRVYRGTTLITTVSGTSYTDTGRTNGTEVSYRVQAFNSEGTLDSNTVSATPNVQNVAPSGIITLTVTPGDGQNELSWNHPSNRGTPQSTYIVFRRTGTSGRYIGIASAITGTTYTDETAANGTTYYYYIRAVNIAGTLDSAAKAGTPRAAVVGRKPSGTITLSVKRERSTVILSWNHPSDRGVPTATYTVTFNGRITRDAGSETRYPTVGAAGTTAFVTASNPSGSIVSNTVVFPE